MKKIVFLIIFIAISTTCFAGIMLAEARQFFWPNLIVANNAPIFWKLIADKQCDGIADEVQFNELISDMPTYPDGDVITCSPGDFVFHNTVAVRGSLKIQGQGVFQTRIALDNDCNMFEGFPSSMQGFFKLEDLYLDGTDHKGHCLICNNLMFDVYIENVFMVHFDSDAIYTDEAWGWVITDIVIEFCGGNGFVLASNGCGPKIESCKIIDNEKHAIHFRDGKNGNIINNELSGLRTGVNTTAVYVKLTTGKDISAWNEGDVVRNDVGDGDDWTGVVFDLYVGRRMTDQQVIVELSSGAYSTVNTADGIENVTKSDTTTLSAKAEYRYASICLEGINLCQSIIVGNRLSFPTNGVGLILHSGCNSVCNNIFTGGYNGIIAFTSYGLCNTIVGNVFYGQNHLPIDADDGRNVIEDNWGYISECSDILSVTGDGSSTTITVTHTLNQERPAYCDRVVKITPASQKMAEATWWISDVNSTKVIISFADALELNETYSFHFDIHFQNYSWSATAASP